MEATSGAFQWLANSFYVLVALAVVYLYFFKIVPLVAGKVSIGSLGGVIQLTLILIVVAILIGFVAVRTADWIFINVLDSLPGTRIAHEIDRVTGPMVELPVGAPNRTIPSVGYGSRSSAPPQPVPTTPSGTGQSSSSGQSNNGSSTADRPAIVLKRNAMSIWAGRVSNIYNPSGRFADNSKEMTPGELPTGVMCRVYATQPERIWRTRTNEPWTLNCSNDEFATSTTIIVNGTAARGLTGGDYYNTGNPMPVYGSGPWPPEAIERTAVPDSGNRQGSTQQSSSAPLSAVQPVASSAGGPAAASAPSLAVENGQQVYTVQTGDSLAKIADTYGVKVYDIVNANSTKYPQMASDNNFIRVGWTLVLP